MQVITAAQAAALIQDRWTVATAGFVGAGHAEAVTAAIERRFEAEAAPRDLTLLYAAGQGDRGRRGVNHFGHAGLVRRVIGGHWISAPRLGDLVIRAGRAYEVSVAQPPLLLRAVYFLLVGWWLGGTVGLGTLAFALLVGPLVGLTLPWCDTRLPAAPAQAAAA